MPYADPVKGRAANRVSRHRIEGRTVRSCLVCRTQVAVTRTGRTAWHTGAGGTECPGTAMPVVVVP